MFKKILIVLFVCVSAHLAGMDKYSTAMGVHFGTSTGNGYSFRRWGETVGQQITFSGYTSGRRDSSHNPQKVTMALGANYLWELHESERYRFYIMAGMSYGYRKVKRDGEWSRNDRWSVGAGPGFEFEFSDRFHLSVELPMTYNHKNEIVPYIPSGGFYYYFK